MLMMMLILSKHLVFNFINLAKYQITVFRKVESKMLEMKPKEPKTCRFITIYI